VIANFPVEIDIISDLSNESTKISPPPRERDSFSNVFSRVTSERPASPRPESRDKKEYKGGEEGSVQPLDDNSHSANLVGGSENLTSSPDVRSKGNSKNLLNVSGQNDTSPVPKAGTKLDQDTPPLLKAVLSRLGLTQEEIKEVTSAKDLNQLKDILQRLGVDLKEAVQVSGKNAGALKGGEEMLLHKLMAALKRDGVPQGEMGINKEIFAELKGGLASADSLDAGGDLKSGIKDLLLQLGISSEEVENMLAKLKGELAPAEGLGEEGQLKSGLKELLLQLGLKPEEVEKLMMGGKDSIDKLKKLFPGLGHEKFNAMLKSENMSVNDLKRLLLKIGADPEQVDKLAGLGEHSDKKVSLKELMRLLNREAENIYDNNAIHSSAKDGNAAGTKGNNDQSGRGEGPISSIVGGEKVVGEKAQVDFEQLMSKADLRKTAPRQVVEQIVKGVKIQVEGGQTKARISLHPPSLGKVNMHIVTRDNQVSATFFAETSLVKEIIESNLPQLRESFQQQGLKVDQFNVFVGHQPAGNQAEQQNFSNAGGSYRSAGEGLEEEEGIIASEQMKRRAMGSHSVDLFI
jgi:hypothetical protein